MNDNDFRENEAFMFRKKECFYSIVAKVRIVDKKVLLDLVYLKFNDELLYSDKDEDC